MTFRRGFMNMWSLSWYDGCLLRDVVYHDVSGFTFHGVYVMTPTGKLNILWEWPGFPTVATSWVNRAAASVIHCMPKNSLQASVCVFSDRMMAHQHLEFVAGQRVCLFWPHDGASALGIRCRPACVSFLTARWHISTWHSLQASVCVFSDRTIAHQHLAFVAGQHVCLFWPHDGTSALMMKLPGHFRAFPENFRQKKRTCWAVSLLWPRKYGIASQGISGNAGLVIAFCGEAPGCKVVEWRASPGAAGRGCTLKFQALDTILLPPFRW